MSAMSSIYRPLTPATPAHTPHGSVGSIRSRTPGQLSLHEYRRQQSTSSPLAEEGNRRLKKKVAVLSFHNGISGIPTAPPTPLEVEFNVPSGTDNEDEGSDADLIKYAVLSAKRDYVESREGASTKLLSYGRSHHHRTNTSTSSTSTGSRSGFLPPTTATRRESWRSHFVPVETPRRVVHAPRLVKFEASPPHSPATPDWPLPAVSIVPSPAFTFSTPESLLHSMNAPSPIVTNDREDDVHTPPKERHFKTIKRLPRPSQPPLEPRAAPSPALSGHRTASPIMTTSLYSPFSLSKFQFPSIPSHKQASHIRKSQSYDNASSESPIQRPVAAAAMSFTDLLHLYGGDFEALNRDKPFEPSKGSQLQGEKYSSLQDLHPLPTFAPKQSLPKMSFFMNDPFNSNGLNSNNHHNVNTEATIPLNRESMYTENWDSRSIIGVSENLPPGRALGIVDYSDLEAHNPQHDSYTPVNRILDQYGRVSADSNMPIPHRSVGKPPTTPPPPVPALPLPKLSLPVEDSTVEHTTDYGMTRDLLRDHSSTPLPYEFSRGPDHALNESRIPSQDYTPSFYDTSASPMPAFEGDPETVSLALSAISDEWQTIANTSTNELSGNLTSMADYAFTPFPTHSMPPLHVTHQRRAVTYDEIPEVPSPQSTLPELDQFLRHGTRSPTPGYDHSVISDYSPDLQPAPDTPDNNHASPMRYTLYDGADMIDVTRGNSPIDSLPKPLHKRNVSTVELPMDRDQNEISVTSPKHESFKTTGMVDPNTLSSEPNDAIDVTSIHTTSETKRQTRLSLLLNLGRASKRSSRNFSNQKDLIELEMPKRTSSLRATELHNVPQNRINQIEGGEVYSPTIIAAPSQSSTQDVSLEQFRSEQSSRSLHKGRKDRRGRVLGIAVQRQFLDAPMRAYARPASSAASTDPLIHDIDLRHHVHHTRALPSIGSGEPGGLRQLYLAEEGAYSTSSPCIKGPEAAIAFSGPEYQRQLKLSRIWFAAFLPFPFFMVLYSLGVMDRLAGPCGMVKNYKMWARNVVFAETVLILIALTVWGVTRHGS